MEYHTNIVLDLDGVLADLDTYVKKELGLNKDELSPKEFWDNVGTIDNFFYQLPKFKHSRKLFLFLSSIPKTKLIIGTGIPRPRGKLKTAAEDKKRWVAKHFSNHVPVYCVEGGWNKFQLIEEGKLNVLIDDMERNIIAWEKAGGIGFLHKDIHDTVYKIAEFFNIDKKVLDILDLE